ncbi:MAG: cob(I)yrinic acid a,c-diamide adenosyltransferase [Candidatus Omnitrophota bacterium]|nr:MAG: cob(I)yrinic acid a,c-diamide adenosyltransferase [Candidatus Omnitrophota bacterium]
MIHLYTGDGKGKTTAAVGLALRAKGTGKKVCIIQFLKGGCASSEIKLLKKVGIKVIRFAQIHPAFSKSVSIPELKKKISHDLERVEEILKMKRYNVVILDEILCVLRDKFIKEKDILRIIKCSPKQTELILTGILSTPKISKLADYISRIKNVKHPYQKGIKARLGIEI